MENSSRKIINEGICAYYCCETRARDRIKQEQKHLSSQMIIFKTSGKRPLSFLFNFISDFCG